MFSCQLHGLCRKHNNKPCNSMYELTTRCTETARSRDSSVVIVTGVWGGERPSDRQPGPALGPIQPSIQCVPWSRWPGREAHLSLLCSAEGKNGWSCTAASPTRLQQLHTSSRVTTRLHRCEVSAIRPG